MRAQILQRGDVAGLDGVNDELGDAFSKVSFLFVTAYCTYVPLILYMKTFADPWVAYPGEVGLVSKAMLQAGPYFTQFVYRSLLRVCNFTRVSKL